MTMNALQILLLTTLVLRSGDRIVVDEPPRLDNGMMVFRSGGLLYSMPSTEVVRTEELPTAEPPAPKKRLAVTEEERKRLIAELEKNHRAGTPPVRQESLERPSPPPTRAEIEAEVRDEWSWRRGARAHEESIRRANEELDLLYDRIARLQREIHTFVSYGYKPRQFTWQTTQLEYTREQIPRAELEVRRAQRAYEQFREDARKQDVLPGWLR